MLLIDNIPALRTAIAEYTANHLAALPVEIRAEMIAASGEVSCVPQFTRTAEALYAAVKNGDASLAGGAREDTATLAGQLAHFVGVTFGTMSADDRGVKIYHAMMREIDGTDTPPVASDPSPVSFA